jgi:archaeal flagellar protein FlaI
MNIPTQKDASKLYDLILSLKNIENKRTQKEQDILGKFYNKEINSKQLISKLKNEKVYENSKTLDAEFVNTFIEYNNQLEVIGEGIEISNIKKYYLAKRLSPATLFFNNLFKSNKTNVEKTEQKKKTTKPKAVEVTIKHPTEHKNIIEMIFGSKKTTKETLKITENGIKPPVFEEPRELLPENYQVLIPGFAYAFIEENDSGKRYIVAEPELTKEESKILTETKQELINKISLTELKDESELIKHIDKIFSKKKINSQQRSKIMYYVGRQIKGLDLIEPLMHDTLIEDIECDGTGIPIFIVHRKYGHLETNISFPDEKELQQFVIKMAHLSKSYVSYASPLLDSILPDGSRVNATLTTNVSTRGPTFTIRKFPHKPLTAIDLINSGTLNPMIVAYIWTVMEFQKTALIIGPTAGGKTTLLNVITSFIPPGRRVVSIEDTREINLLLDNWVPQITRPGFGPPDGSGKKYGEVTMLDLIKESFRQRPDYLIVGEVRGEEMSVMFQGMASGHCCLSTVHARSLPDLVNRLITPPISLEPALLTSLDLVIVTGFEGGSDIKRTIKELDEIKGFNSKDNKIEYNAIYNVYDRPEKKEGDLFTHDLPITYKSEILKSVSREYNLNINDLLEMINKRIKFIEELTRNPPKDYVEFKIAINKYKLHEKVITN